MLRALSPEEELQSRRKRFAKLWATRSLPACKKRNTLSSGRRVSAYLRA